MSFSLFLNNPLWTGLAAVMGVWVVAVLLPGPNFIATVHTAGRHGRTPALFVVLGVASGTATWAVGSLLGLGLLFKAAAWLYGVIKFGGAAYLIYTGIRMLFSAKAEKCGHAQSPASCPADARLTPEKPSFAKAYTRGLLVNLSNPKTAVFFTSLFAVSIDPQSPAWFKALVVCLVVSVSLAWYSSVACLMSTRPFARLMERGQKWIERAAGGLFVLLGLKLALAKD